MTPQTPSNELREALQVLRPYFVRAAMFSITAGLLMLAPTGYMLEVYDRVVNSRNHLTLIMLTVLVLVAFVVMEVLDWARTAVMHEAGLLLDRKMTPRIFGAIFDANLKKVPGGSGQPMADFRTLRDFLQTPVLLAMFEAPVALVFLVLVFMIHPILGWVSLAGAVVQTLLAWLTERTTKPPLAEANRTAIEAQTYADATLRNAEVVESMGMLRDIHRRWIEKQREFLNLQAKASDAAGGFQAATKLIQQLLGSLVLGLGAWLTLRNEFPAGAGMMIVASVLGGRVLAPLVQIVSQWRAVVNVRDAWNRLNELLTHVPKKPDSMPLPPPKGHLVVESLVAGAPGSSTPIIRNAAFTLQPGDVLAVVGPSASGKTTLARLLVGLWPALSGKVRLDGADVYTLDKDRLGPHVGYLPQGVELFEGTLAENIARFGTVEKTKVIAAARAVGLHEYIQSLPEGYDSPVGRDGAILSGGQRQRVALARALYGDPAYVVLDEPNSNLDDDGDAALASAILQLQKLGTTFVVMTHRTSVLAVANKVLVMLDGAQQMFGPRDEVLAALRKINQQASQNPAQQGAPQPPTSIPVLAATRDKLVKQQP